MIFNNFIKVNYRLILKSLLYFLFPQLNKSFWKNRELKFFRQELLPQEKIDFIFKDIDLSHVETILEVGCGPGYNLFQLSSTFPEKMFYGIDINKKAIQHGIEFCEKYKIKNVILYNCDLLDQNLMNNIFKSRIDLIFSWAVLMYVHPKDITKAIRNLMNLSHKFFVLLELSHNYSFGISGIIYPGTRNWARNWDRLINNTKIVFTKITCKKIPPNIWQPGGRFKPEIIICEK